MAGYKQWLITLASTALLAACGGGNPAMDARSSVASSPGVGTAGSPSALDDQSDGNGDVLSPETARPSPAEVLGIQRPPRPESFGASPPGQPARTPHHIAITLPTLRQYCPVQPLQWTSHDGAQACAGTTPIGVRPGSSSTIRVDNALPASMGWINMQCRRDEAGLPHWVVVTPALLFPWNTDTTPYSSCALRPPPRPPITDPQQLAQARNCFACHLETGGTLIGPSFEQVADRYRDDPLPPGELESRIRNGTVRNWNTFPMPANPQVSDADLAILVPWILSR